MGRARWPSYRRGYMGRDYHVTGGHEDEARAAQRRRKPNRIGIALLRLLGYRGPAPRPSPTEAASPDHQRPHPPPA